MKKFKVLALSVLLLISAVLIVIPTTTNAAPAPGGWVKGLMLGGICFCPAASDYNCLCWDPTPVER